MPPQGNVELGLSAEQFIERLIEQLSLKEELNQEVVAVLKTHLLTSHPADTAADATARALEALATERARAGRTA